MTESGNKAHGRGAMRFAEQTACRSSGEVAVAAKSASRRDADLSAPRPTCDGKTTERTDKNARVSQAE